MSPVLTARQSPLLLLALALPLGACGPGAADGGDDIAADTDSESSDGSTESGTTTDTGTETTSTDGSCTTNADCPGDMICIDGMCGFDPCLDSTCDDGPPPPHECFGDLECRGGVCLFFSCFPAPELPTCNQAPSFALMPIPDLLPFQARAAVGNFDGDPLPEIVVLRSGDMTQLSVFSPGDAATVDTVEIIEPNGMGLLPLQIDADDVLDLLVSHDLWLGDGDGHFSWSGNLPDID
ncbi:MAG: hypothetical protein KC457_18055, partial [Myxococcales bacterium]|nr:hypothetical protein [Myxococcales bacterium]